MDQRGYIQALREEATIHKAKIRQHRRQLHDCMARLVEYERRLKEFNIGFQKTSGERGVIYGPTGKIGKK